jgi:hypothetical protein
MRLLSRMLHAPGKDVPSFCTCSHASLLTDFVVDHTDTKTHIQADIDRRTDQRMNRQTYTRTDCQLFYLKEEETFIEEGHTSWTCNRWSAAAASSTWTDGCIDRRTDRQTNVQMGRQTDRHIDGRKDRHPYTQTYRQPH